MTDRDIIIRLATEVMGWKTVLGTSKDEPFFWWPADREPVYCANWNPLASWGDVMELEGNLPATCRPAYLRELCFVTDAFMEGRCSKSLHERDWKLISATPRQRCEAMTAALDTIRISGDSVEKTTEYKPKTP